MSIRVAKVLTYSLVLALTLTGTVQARWLVINSIPSDATVFINDGNAGNTPVRLEGAEGETVTISLRLDSYDDYSFAYDFVEDKVIFLDLIDGVELDEATYWEKKTSGNTKKVSDILPTATPEVIEEIPAKAPELIGVAEPAPIPADFYGKNYKGLAVYELLVDPTGQVETKKLKTRVADEFIHSYLDMWVDSFQFDPGKQGDEAIAETMNIRIIYDLDKAELQLPDHEIVYTVSVQDTEIEPAVESVVETDTDTSEEPAKDPVDSETATEETTADVSSPEPVEVVEIVETDPPELETDETEADNVVYYEADDVDRPAKIFSPPSLGDIPVELINLNLKGEADFKVYISETGEVRKVEVIKSSGNKTLDDFALPMIKTSFWEPAKKGGNPVNFVRALKMEYHTLTVKFEFPGLYE